MLSKNKKKLVCSSRFRFLFGICLVFLFTLDSLFFSLSLFFFSFCLYVCKTSIFCERINYQLTNVRSQCVLSFASGFFSVYVRISKRKSNRQVYTKESFFLSSLFFLFGRETRDRQMLTLFNLREEEKKKNE